MLTVRSDFTLGKRIGHMAGLKVIGLVGLVDWDSVTGLLRPVAFDLLRDALSAIFGLSELKIYSGAALTWWNSHVRTVTNDVAYAMTWTDLKKKMTTKYCPRNEIKKIEAEMWNLKVKGTDVVAYNQRFQELALLCDRMFPEETDKIERVNNVKDKNVNTDKPKAVVNDAKPKAVVNAVKGNNVNAGNLQLDVQDQGVIDSGCSRHMIGNMSYLTDYEEIDGGYVAFGGNPKGGKITGRVPRKNNMYSVDLKNIIPKEGLTCLFAKATSDESELWHTRLGHINFKPMNKWLREIYVRDDYSRFSWVFFLATKDETSGILKSFITRVENLIDQRVKVIRCDNRTEFKNKEMNQFCERKGKFDGKSDEGFFVGYSINSKAFRVFNSGTRIVEENLHVQFSKNTPNIAGSTKACDDAGKARMETVSGKEGGDLSKEDESINQEKDDNINSTNNVNVTSTNEVNVIGGKTSIELLDDPNMLALENYSIFDSTSDDQDIGAEADMNNLDAFMHVSPIPTTRVHKDHPVEQIIGDLNLAPLTRRMIKNLEEHVYQMDVKSAFLYGKMKRKSMFVNHQDLKIQTSLTEYKKLKKHCMDYIKLLELDDIIFGSTKKSLCTEFEKMMHKKFQMSSMGELTFFLGLQVKQKEDGIFISQDKYVTEILKKFGFTNVKTASTPMETQKLLLKDEDGEEVDVHLYRSMIGSLMYLTSSRPDIMFAVCACARYQVNPKVSHLHAVKRIFRYLKGQPKLGLWYPKDSPFDLVAYTDSDYAGASLDRKSTTGGCQFLESRLISWQCKKQTVVANSTTEAEYATVKAKTVNGEVKLQALVDGKKIIIIESIVRRDLQLEDDEGIDCLPNATIFEHLTLMGYEKVSQKLTFYKAFFSPQWKFLIHTVLQCLSAKTTAWNEFSSTMASAIIYKQLEGMQSHKRIYDAPSHTKKIFGNMKRAGKGFSGRETSLFPTMVVQNQAEMGEDEAVYEEMDDSLERAATTATSLDADQDRGNINKTQSKATLNEPSSLGTSSGSGPRRQETMRDTIAQTGFENVSKTSNDSLLAGTSQAQEIISLKRRVKRLEKKNRSKTHVLKRLYKVGLSARIESSEDKGLGEEDASC
ncbi:uncharacterized mitochondrial protein-like protein [Tanacetum coccineum]